jgi:hypothetical protein
MTSDVGDAPAVESDNAPRVVSVIITSYNYGRFLGRRHRERSRPNVFRCSTSLVVDDGRPTKRRPSLERMQIAAWPMSVRRESGPRVLATPASE